MDLTGIDPSRIPRHVAVVTDGSALGEEPLFDTLDGAVELGLERFTVCPSGPEASALDLGLLERHADDLAARGIRLQVIGRREGVPSEVAQRIDAATERTAGGTGLTLTVAVGYGGRAEIVDAVKRLVADGVAPHDIDEAALHARMYDPSVPDPELLVRTAGALRISDHLLWELAYSELVFTGVAWAGFRRQHLADAVREFQARERRFGKVSSA